MSVKLLTEYNLEFLSLKGGWQASLSLYMYMSKFHNVGNHMSWLLYRYIIQMNQDTLRQTQY